MKMEDIKVDCQAREITICPMPEVDGGIGRVDISYAEKAEVKGAEKRIPAIVVRFTFIPHNPDDPMLTHTTNYAGPTSDEIWWAGFAELVTPLIQLKLPRWVKRFQDREFPNSDHLS